MWIYEKKLEFPVKITTPDARLAKIMIEQYGGPEAALFLWRKKSRQTFAGILKSSYRFPLSYISPNALGALFCLEKNMSKSSVKA